MAGLMTFIHQHGIVYSGQNQSSCVIVCSSVHMSDIELQMSVFQIVRDSTPDVSFVFKLFQYSCTECILVLYYSAVHEVTSHCCLSYPRQSEGICFSPTLVCLSVCLSVTTITKTIVDGFVPNFM